MTLQQQPAPVPQAPTNSLLAAVATGLTDQDRRRIEDALDRSVSANNRVMYTSPGPPSRRWLFALQ